MVIGPEGGQAVGAEECGVAGGDVNFKGPLVAAVKAAALVAVGVGQYHVLYFFDAYFIETIEPAAAAKVDGNAAVAAAQQVDVAGVGVEEEVAGQAFPGCLLRYGGIS